MKYLLTLVTLLSLTICVSADRLRGFNVAHNIDGDGIQVLENWGSNLVRYGFANNEADDLTIEEYNAWVEEIMEDLDALLPLFEAADQKVILNLHTPPGGFSSRTGRPQHRVFDSVEYQEALKDVWEVIANHYLDDDRIYAFELMNEPAQGKLGEGVVNWKTLYPELISLIQAIDPDRKFIIQPKYGDIGQLKRIITTNDPSIIYSIHFYYPFKITAQGENGRPDNIELTREFKRKIRNKLRKAKKVLRKKEINPENFFVGEFSIVRWGLDAHKYLDFVIKKFERFGWSWAYHAFRESNVWSLEHTDNKNEIEYATQPTQRLKTIKSHLKNNE